MPRRHLPRPTDTELAILRAIWEIGPATVREVHEVINQVRETGYTTVLKMMQIMTEKGLLQRDDSSRSHVYEPTVNAEHTRRQLVRDLAERAFAGSASQLALHALTERPVSHDELEKIKSLIHQLEDAEQSGEVA